MSRKLPSKWKILLVIFVILVPIYKYCEWRNERIKNTIESLTNEFSNEIYDYYRVSLNKGDYVIKFAGTYSNSIITFNSYKIEKKEPIVYKSKYFTRMNNEYVRLTAYKANPYSGNMLFFGNENSSEFESMISKYGLKPYLLNEFLYDKEKGNNFLEIEKIFDEIKDRRITVYTTPYWRCNKEIKENLNDILFVLDNECDFDNERKKYISKVDEKDTKYYKKMLQYGNRLQEYFNEKNRNFSEIDWYEFMKYNNIHPVILFYIEGIPESKLVELRERIKPYYNHEEISILLSNSKENFTIEADDNEHK